MIRIRLPGGRAGAGQLRAIAGLGQIAGNDRIALTNLANFQVRGLERIGFSQLKQHLDQANLLPKQRWADRRRNILGDPLSGLVAGEICPTAQLIAQLDAAIQAEPLMKASSLKFGFAVDGGGLCHIGGQLHDAALIAEGEPSNPRFRLYLTGRATGFTARPDQAAALAVTAAVAALGFPSNRDTSGLKYLKDVAYGREAGLLAGGARLLLALAGPQETRIRRLLGHVAWEDLIRRIASRLPAELADQTQPPDTLPDTLPDLAPRIGIVEQLQPGKVICGFGVPLGRLDSRRLNLIAGLAEDYGTGEVRLSSWHVVFIPHVDVARADELLRKAEQAGFATGGNFLHFDLSACSGRSGCRGARLETQDHALAVMQAVNKLDLPDTGTPVSIHISGCPKGCAHRTASDVLALEREDASGYYLYEASAALTPDVSRKFNGCLSPAELPDAVCRLIGQRGLASGRPSRHNPPDITAD